MPFRGRQKSYMQCLHHYFQNNDNVLFRYILQRNTFLLGTYSPVYFSIHDASPLTSLQFQKRQRLVFLIPLVEPVTVDPLNSSWTTI